MSAYMEFKAIQFVSGDLLVKALQEIGYAPEVGEAINLIGYAGDRRPQQAQIVVRRAQIGTVSNDLGFKWTGKAFIPIISDFDARNKLDQKWRDRLQATYSKLAVLKILAGKGAKVLGAYTTDDGLVVLKAEVTV